MIAGKTWRELRVMALVYLAILELLTVPVILLWPDIYADLQRSTLLRNMGVDWLKRIGEGVSNRDEDVAYLNWIAVMLFFRSANLVGLAAAVLLGTGLFARERESHTFEFLLARPVSRTSILWQKSWPTALCLLVPLFLANLSALYWSARIDLHIPVDRLLWATVHAAAFTLCFLAATTWMSVRCRVQAHVAFVIGGFTILQIGIYLTQRWRVASLFRLADFEWYAPILTGNLTPAQMFDPIHERGFTTWILLATVVFYLLAWRELRRAEP
ncbi:MAG: ABC transporter permease subunit [Planctomycetes bacterium]|nr:ABC transporter permease subunit [Planctomycetota bacterium]